MKLRRFGFLPFVLYVISNLRNPVHAVIAEQARLQLNEGAASEPVRLRWVDGWVLLKVGINGIDAGWFKIGTGWGSSAIDGKVAKRLKLPEISAGGLLKAMDEPAENEAARSFRVDSLECGPVHSGGCCFFDGGESLAQISLEADKLYGEGVSGVLGWDLLQTQPFLLDYGGLTLTWQSRAAPAKDAVKMALLEPHVVPLVEEWIGKDIKARILINTAGSGISFDRTFLVNHATQLWTGRRSRGLAAFYSQAMGDDDALPTAELPAPWPSRRWVSLSFGGRTLSVPGAVYAGTALPVNFDAQIGYEVMRSSKVLFDGPGNAVWVIPSAEVPETTMVRQGQSKLPVPVMDALLYSAAVCNDAGAVKTLAAAGASLKSRDPKSEGPLTRACEMDAREAALAMLQAGARPDPRVAGLGTDWPLAAAIRVDDGNLVQALLDKSANPGMETAERTTSLLIAAGFGSLTSWKTLRTQASLTPFSNEPAFLINACTGGNPVIVKEIAALQTSPRGTAPEGVSLFPVCLERALLSGHDEVVAWILKTHGEAARQGDRLQPLLAAIMPAGVEKTDAVRGRLVQRLLAAGADPNASRGGVTPLLLAARHGDAAIVKALLAAGANPKARDFKGRNALQRAAAANQPAILIAPLLKQGLDPDATDSSDSDMTALGQYAMHGNAAACEALLAAGAHPDARGSFGASPLFYATHGEEATDAQVRDVIQLLIKHGAKPDACSGAPGSGESASLLGAVKAGRASVVEMMVHAGVAVNGTIIAKLSPLATAAAISDPSTVSCLLQLGADPNSVDVEGISVLGHAAAAGRLKNMQLLTGKGALVMPAGPKVVPPLWVAVAAGQLEAARMLLSAGADASLRHPELKTTALEAAVSREDTAMIGLLTGPHGK